MNGPSGAGKSEFILSMLKSDFFVDNFSLVVYCIPHNTAHLPNVKRMIDRLREICKSVVIFEGILSDTESVFHPISEKDACLVIVDDLWPELIESRAFTHFVTFGSRHTNCSLVVTSQNMFQAGKYAVSIRRQFQYLTIFMPTAEKQILVNIGRNLFPSNPMCLINCFKKLIPYTKTPYEQYIFIDTHPLSPLGHNMRLRSNVFDKDEPYFFIVEDD